MARRQHDSNASICLPDLKDLIIWLAPSAEVSISARRHASVFMCSSYLQIFSCCLPPSPHNILPLGSIFILLDPQTSGSTFTLVKHPVEKQHSGVRQTINFVTPTLHTAGLARERWGSRRCSSRRGPSAPEVLRVALSSGALQELCWCCWKLRIILR